MHVNGRRGSLLAIGLAGCQTVTGGTAGKVVAQHEWETPQGRRVTLELEVVQGSGVGEKVRLALSDAADDEGPGELVAPGIGALVPLRVQTRADGLHQFSRMPEPPAWPWWVWTLPILGIWMLLKARQLLRRRRFRRKQRQAAMAIKPLR